MLMINAFPPRLTGRLNLASLLFWAAASIPFLVLSLLFVALFTITPARASQIACSGSNVLTALQAKNPAAYQALVAEAATVPNGKGILWKVEKPGLKTSWLMGTMHMTDPRVLKMPNGAAEAFAAAGTVIIESDEILDNRKAAMALMAKPELTMFTDGTTISGLLGKEESGKLAAGLKTRGISLALVEKMQPWMIAGLVSLPACELSRKAEGADFLDMKIARDAVAEGKELKGLETMTEQLSAMADLPVKMHLAALIETLDLGDRMEDIMATMLDLYTTGDIGMIVPMLNAATGDTESQRSEYAAFEQRIVIDRNHVMATRAAPSFEKGGVFMAVGALHLPGKEGVIELLRQSGFQLTAVN